MVPLIIFIGAFILSAVFLGVFSKHTYYVENTSRFKAAGIVRPIAAFFIALVIAVM